MQKISWSHHLGYLTLAAAFIALVVMVVQPGPAAGLSSWIDYDTDDDGLIEIGSLEQLDAIRWDPDGDGSVATDSGTVYVGAFPDPAPGMGCPSASCVGYELVRDLDFRDPGSYENGQVNADWIGGEGWRPIDHLAGSFHGNSHTISNLYIRRNMLRVGLFGTLEAEGSISHVRLADADVAIPGMQTPGAFSPGVGILVGWSAGTIKGGAAEGRVSGYQTAGGLVGRNNGWITGSYSSAEVTATPYGSIGGLAGINEGTILGSYAQGDVIGIANSTSVGGLVGDNGGFIGASYATGSVSGLLGIGGLVGSNYAGAITESYAAGPVSGVAFAIGGFLGYDGGSVDSCYWDVQTSGTSTGVGSYASAGVTGLTTSRMTEPIGYEGVYADWGSAFGDYDAIDYHWDFGSHADYPVLATDFDGDGTATWEEFGQQRILDYDVDDDGLIEISNLEALNGVRWDSDGDGSADDPANAGDYRAAFPLPIANTGCPDDGCRGYELAADLDFDDAGSYRSGVVNKSWRNGAGWKPIEVFTGTFDGNNHAIAGLYVTRNGLDLGLFALNRGIITRVRMVDVHVNGNHGISDEGVGALVGENVGTVSFSSSSGAIALGFWAGGLVGQNSGTVVGSYSETVVGTYEADGSAYVGGGLVGFNNGRISVSYATGPVTTYAISGGLVGKNVGSIDTCYASGEVWVYYGGSTLSAGGLVGLHLGNLANCYSVGRVDSNALDVHLGGLAGHVHNDDGNMTISDSYWDYQTTHQESSEGGGTGEPTETLQGTDGYIGIYSAWKRVWDVAGDKFADAGDPWYFGTETDYPRLRADFDGDGVASWQEFGQQWPAD